MVLLVMMSIIGIGCGSSTPTAPQPGDGPKPAPGAKLAPFKGAPVKGKND
ncbi:hypothetical protein [Zavarzinella formosa]|nr:hypothetical protein [Zavarzinella formosa]